VNHSPRPEGPTPFRLALLDYVFIAGAIGCVLAIVVADRPLALMKPALAFWGATCVAGVAINIALRSAHEASALRRRVRHLEDELDALRRDVARLLREVDGERGGESPTSGGNGRRRPGG